MIRNWIIISEAHWMEKKLTGLQTPEEKEKSKHAEYPTDLRFGVLF